MQLAKAVAEREAESVQGRKHFFFKKEACRKGESDVTQSRAGEMNAL